MKKILFICHGNICRSTMAEALAKDYIDKNNLSDFYVESAATSKEELGNPPDYRTLKKLEEKGVSIDYLANKKARQVRKDEYENWDIFICMDDNNLRNIRRIFKEDSKKKIYKVADLFFGQKGDIADPWYTGDFEKTYNDLNKAVGYIIENMNNINNIKS